MSKFVCIPLITPGYQVDNTINHCQVDKLFRDVRDGGLGLLVLAEWFNPDVMQKIRFFDDNTSELFVIDN